MSNQDIKVRDKTQAVSGGESTKTETYYSPPVDIFETGDAVIVVADIPGVTKDNIEVSLDDGILTLHGKMITERPEGRIILEEYENGHYMRRFTVSESIDQGKIEASLANGVLTVTLPKIGPVQPKKIQVKMG